MVKKAHAIRNHLWFGVLFLYKNGMIFKDLKAIQITLG